MAEAIAATHGERYRPMSGESLYAKVLEHSEAQARAFMRARKVGVAGYRQQLAAARPKVLAWRPPNAA